jgi:predicted transcriptional regulator
MEKIVGISNLEAEILLIVWDKGTATNREVYEAFIKKDIKNKKSGFIPYTNILSTMNSLARKKILKVDKSRKIYKYSPAVTREELTRSIVKSVEEKFL